MSIFFSATIFYFLDYYIGIFLLLFFFLTIFISSILLLALMWFLDYPFYYEFFSLFCHWTLNCLILYYIFSYYRHHYYFIIIMIIWKIHEEINVSINNCIKFNINYYIKKSYFWINFFNTTIYISLIFFHLSD